MTTHEEIEASLAAKLFEHIKHGDAEHQRWLAHELNAWFEEEGLDQLLDECRTLEEDRDLWRVLRDNLADEVGKQQAELDALRAENEQAISDLDRDHWPGWWRECKH